MFLTGRWICFTSVLYSARFIVYPFSDFSNREEQTTNNNNGNNNKKQAELKQQNIFTSPLSLVDFSGVTTRQTISCAASHTEGDTREKPSFLYFQFQRKLLMRI